MLLAALLATVSLVAAKSVSLPKWHISANQLTVAAGRLAADLTIANDDEIGERFELTAYSWEQRSGADVRRRDVDGVLIFPRLFELAPGERKSVRIGVLEADAAVESDYRVSVEQLFDPSRGRPGIHFLLAYDIPLFIAPVQPVTDAHFFGIGVHGNELRVTERNDGNVHAFARRIVVTWRGASTSYAGVFYVLPRATMIFSFPLRGCGSGTVRVAANEDARIGALSAPISVPCPEHARDAEIEPAMATLRINGVDRGDVVVVRTAHDLYARARDLLGVPFPRPPTTRRIHGELYDALASSGVAYAYDAASLTLDLSYVVSTVRRIVVPVPAPPLYDNGSSATIDYAETLERNAPELSARATVAMPGGQLHLGFTKIGGAIYRSDLDGVLYPNGQSGAILLGDQTLASGGALPSLPLFGIGATRGTLSRTNAESAPFERISGTLPNPTTIAIEVAGEQRIELGVEPGSFSIDGIPISARVSAVDEVTNLPVQIDVRPPLGAGLIAPGWREIDVAAGVPRVCIYECSAYRGTLVGGSLLEGDSLFLASGPYAEFLDGRAGVGYDLVDADPTHALRLSGGIGPLGGVLGSYEQRAGAVSFAVGYAASGAPAFDESGTLVAPRRSISQIASLAYRRLRVQFERRNDQPLANLTTYEVVDDVPFFARALRLVLAEQRAARQPGRISLGILLAISLKRWRDATLLGATIGAHQGPAAVLASRIDLPSGLAIAGSANGELQASYASDAVELTGSDDGIFTFSGALAFLHGVHVVRDPSNGYAVAVGEADDLIDDRDGRVHTVGSATAFALAGSDRVTEISYAQRDETADSVATLSTSHLFPAPGAGELVVIRHARLFAVMGKIADPRWRDGTIALSSGLRSPIGSDGMFYFERLAVGSYRATVTGAGGACRAFIVVPASTARQIDVGTISCAP